MSQRRDTRAMLAPGFAQRLAPLPTSALWAEATACADRLDAFLADGVAVSVSEMKLSALVRELAARRVDLEEVAGG